MEDKVLEYAKKGGFDYIQKLNIDWKGNQVYYPCGPKGETLYLGAPVFFLANDEKVRVATNREAEDICRATYEPSDFCD